MSRTPLPATLPADRMPAADVVATPPGAEPALEWTMDPWREHARRAALGAALAVGLAVVAFTAVGGGLVGLVLALLALVSLSPAFLVVRCRVDGEGVSRTAFGLTERRPWADVRSARLGAAALRVGPSRRPGVLEGFRGLTLPLPEGAAARELREELRRRIEHHGL